MGAISKEERKEKKYLTENRLITINRRETSFEGLVEKFENGEDGIYNIMTNDKNILLQPKAQITEHDIDTIPGLRELRDAIAQIDEACKAATGKRKYLLKKQLIEMRKDQYILKSAFAPAMNISTSARGINKIDLSERRYLDENGEPQSTGLISLFNPLHISAILCNYNALKIETRGKYWDDFFYLMEDFDILLRQSLADHPLYKDLVALKMAGKQNTEIRARLEEDHGIKYSAEYISSLWRNKIPKLIADYEKEKYLIWYYTNEKPSRWKTCSCCGKSKPAHNAFFSKNKTSKDGWYSLCKVCRNSRRKEKK